MSQCSSVQVQQSDASELVLDSFDVLSGTGFPEGAIGVTATASNQVVSGSGESIPTLFEVYVDGSQVAGVLDSAATAEIAPGDSYDFSMQFDVGTGSHTVELVLKRTDTDGSTTVDTASTSITLEQNASEASFNLDSVGSPSANAVRAVVTVSNNITSGDGETLSPTVFAELNGGNQQSESPSLSPGESVQVEFNWTGVAGGSTAEVCAGLQ